MAADSDEVLVAVPHIKQQYRWDCGLACSQMVLRFLNKNIDDMDEVCQSLGIGHSVWTIDLAQIMCHYRIKHHFCTVTLGVDVEYSNKAFYKERFDVDQRRVNELFEQSQKLGLSIEKRTVTLNEIKSHLAQHQVAIVLIDWNLLNCQSQSTIGCAVQCVGQCFNLGGSYQGHFIVVCGYNAKTNTIYYRNPSSKRDCCVCTSEVFERSRTAHGTDQDILFIYSEPLSLPIDNTVSVND